MAGADKMDQAKYLLSQARYRFEESIRQAWVSGCRCRLCNHFDAYQSGNLEIELWLGFSALYSLLPNPHAIPGSESGRRYHRTCRPN